MTWATIILLTVAVVIVFYIVMWTVLLGSALIWTLPKYVWGKLSATYDFLSSTTNDDEEA